MAKKTTASTKSKTGPKTNWKLTDEVVRKLEEAAAIDATVEEMCFYADISRDTFYRWIKENPEFSDRINRLRERPVLVARQTVVNSISKDPKIAMEYLKAKRRAEFATKQEVETTGETAVTITYVHPTDSNRTDNQAGPDLAEAPGPDDN